MARTPTFERSHVVEQARAVFWARGYEASSIPELEEATGLSRSSIYNSFGSKRGLFAAAVDSYLEQIVRPRLRPLLAQSVDPAALRHYLEGLARAFTTPGSVAAANGCLLISSANAPIADDGQIAEVIADYRRELHHALARGVHAALPDTDVRHRALLADTLTGLVVAAFALARILPEEAARLLHNGVELLDT